MSHPTFHVLLRHWHENPIGEQGNGPEILAGRFPTREEAERYAESVRVVREETPAGGAYGTWVHVRPVGGESEGDG